MNRDRVPPNSLAAVCKAVSYIEHEEHTERTVAGLARARAQGRVVGRSRVVFDPQIVKHVAELRSNGLSYGQIGIRLGVSKSHAVRMFATTVKVTVT